MPWRLQLALVMKKPTRCLYKRTNRSKHKTGLIATFDSIQPFSWRNQGIKHLFIMFPQAQGRRKSLLLLVLLATIREKESVPRKLKFQIQMRATKQRKKREREVEHFTMIWFWTSLGLFFGLRGGFFPKRDVKSSSISPLNKETENFTFSFFSESPWPCVILVGSLQAALLVLRFHGRAASATAAASSPPPFPKVETFGGFPSQMGSMLRFLLSPWSGEGGKEEEEGKLTHLRDLWWPHRR